jgi:hypothetical protein
MKETVAGLVLCSGLERPMPSTRIAVLNMLPYLERAGLRCTTLFAPHTPNEVPDLDGVAERALALGCSVVLFQKVHGARAVATAHTLRAAGVKTVFAVCDRVEVAMAEACDATVVVTDFLRSLYPPALQHKVHVVHDGIENPAACKRSWSDVRGSAGAPLGAVLVTSSPLDHLPVIDAPPPWLRVRIVGGYGRGAARLRELRTQWAEQDGAERRRYLRFLFERRVRCVPWGADSVYTELDQADIGILPVTPGHARWGVDHADAWRRKSENRLTLKMSAGLPVIATPIPAYEAIIEHGVNGFFARSRADWLACLEELREPERRRTMGAAARAAVCERFSMQAQADGLLAVLARAGAP